MNDQVSEEEFFDFKCPHCGGDASFPRTASGQAHECPNCFETLVVPGPGESSARPLPVPIRTARLTLRRFQWADVRDLSGLCNDEELSPDVHATSEEAIEQWLAKDLQMKFTTPNEPFYLAVALPTGLIGWGTVQVEPRYRREANVRIVVGRQHQRQGFGAEALVGLLDFCFRGVHLHRVVAECDRRNEAARRLLEKAGLRREAELIDSQPDGDSWATILWYAMLDREYRPAPEPKTG